MKKAKDHFPKFIIHMKTKKRIPRKIKCESFLIGILYLVGTLSLYEDVIRRGRLYVYSTITMIQLLIIKTWMRIPSNNTLYYFLSLETANREKILSVCRLNQIPDRRTFDRRFKILPVREIIANMGNVFLSEIVDYTTASLDSSMIPAQGPVWHKSDMRQNRIPISRIDIDARWAIPNQKDGYLDTSCTCHVPLENC